MIFAQKQISRNEECIGKAIEDVGYYPHFDLQAS